MPGGRLDDGFMNGSAPAGPGLFLSSQLNGIRPTVSLNTNENGGPPSSPPVSLPLSPPSGGKSSRVIDRLQGDNERLKRDLNYERKQKEEATKSLSLTKSMQENYQERINHLTMCHETDMRSLDRKDRKIEELKKAIEAETARRVRAEAREAEMAGQLDTTIASAHQAVSEARDREKRADVHANTVQQGFKGLQAEVQKTSRDFTRLCEDKAETFKKVKNLEIVLDQNAHEMVRKDELVRRMRKQMEAYTKMVDEELGKLVKKNVEMVQKLAAHEEESDELHAEMKEAADKMKWTLNIHRMREEE